MAKKVSKTSAPLAEQASTGAAAAKKKASASRPKHIKAQAVAVAAAVEGFVHALSSPTLEPIAEKEPLETAAPALVEEALAPAFAPEPAAEVTPEVTEPELHSTGEVSHEEISVLAYRFFLERGGRGGSPADDWFRAEQVLSSGRI